MSKFDKQVDYYLDEDWKSTAASAMLGAGLMFGGTPDTKASSPMSHIEHYQPPANAPRGVRNNNPGNIEISREDWVGKTKGSDSRFETFVAPEWGIRAVGRVLMTYANTHKLNTIHDIIHRWAPEWRTLPNGKRVRENDTPRYIRNMEKITGLKAHQPLNLTTNHENMKKVIRGIIQCENSFQYPEHIIDKALGVIFINPSEAEKIFTQQYQMKFAQR